MFGREVQEVVLLGVSLCILSMVLGFGGYLLNIRSDLASQYNQDMLSVHSLQEYREYNKYNEKQIKGADVIELFVNLKYNELELYVDKLNGGSEFYVNSEIVKKEPDKVKLATLQDTILPKVKYNVYLVYDFADIRDKTKYSKNGEVGAVLTGIAVEYVG